jgi:hypothetical protein
MCLRPGPKHSRKSAVLSALLYSIVGTPDWFSHVPPSQNPKRAKRLDGMARRKATIVREPGEFPRTIVLG